MKANYVNSCVKRIQQQSSLDLLQEIENSFAKKHGIIPKEVVFGPINIEETRQAIIDYISTIFYPINKEEYGSFENFRKAVEIEQKDLINKEVYKLSTMVQGCFFRSRKDQIFVYECKPENLVRYKHLLKHETFHSGIYDLICGRIPKIRVYKSKQHDSEFLTNLLTESKLQTIVKNKAAKTQAGLNKLQIDLFHNYSLEEFFVDYNACCSMLEEEISKPVFDIENILTILNTHIANCGLIQRKTADKIVTTIYGKTIPLKNFMETYLSILRGPVDQYDEEDKLYYECTFESSATVNDFEIIESPIPDLFDDLIAARLKYLPNTQLVAIINRHKREWRSNQSQRQLSKSKNNPLQSINE